jgi:hypothetical protein
MDPEFEKLVLEKLDRIEDLIEQMLADFDQFDAEFRTRASPREAGNDIAMPFPK